MGKINNAVIKIQTAYKQYKRRRKLSCKDFSIISNNCWAGTAVYQPFGLKYNTPTVGLFIMDEDYIQFIEKINYYITQPLEFIDPRKSKYYFKISNGGKSEIKYPIATLDGDIEIHFLHYNNPKEALAKWQRRVKRINWNKLVVKMSLRDSGYDIERMLRRFEALPFKNKICFTPECPESIKSNDIIVIPELLDLNLVGGDETDCTLQHIDIIKLLNNIV